MPLRSHRFAYISAALLAALATGPAFGHDDKEGAGGGGETPGGMPFTSFSAHNMVLRSRLDLGQLAPAGHDTSTVMLASAWGWTDPDTSKEYALVCRRTDLAIVDISDPDNPVLIGNVLRNGAATTWRDVRVVGNYAYIGADATNAGIQSFDLTQVRGVTTPTIFTADALYTGVSNSHSLGVNLNTSTPYLYVAGANTMSGVASAPQTPGGLQILDVSSPTAIIPATLGGYQLDNYIHETVIFTYNGPDTAHIGKEIAFNNNGQASTNSMSILDATDKNNLVRLSESVYPNTGYTHQGYLTDDHRFYLINDELDETGQTLSKTRTHLYDVSDLDNPQYKGFFEWGNGNIDHNFYIVGDFLYEANYTRGIRVFKIWDLDSEDPADWLQEVAWLDTYPADDSKTFNGVWQVYPFFESGNIILSDINGGLFVVNFVPEPAGVGLLALCALVLLRRRR